MKRVHNFGAGPGQLPLPVIQKLSEDLISYKNTGIGVAELSHRSPEFEDIISRTKAKLKTLLSIPEGYEIIFCTGGATQQFSMIPMNFLSKEKVASYIVTGIWGKKAEEEAKKFGKTVIATEDQLHSNAAYLHFTSNDTIEGRQFSKEPSCGSIPLVCDASSDIASRPIDISKYSLIYAGAQKNLGVAGVTVVIIKRSFVETINKELPILLDYRTYLKHNSLYNTPPTSAIYTVELVLDWINQEGGLKNVASVNTQKADLLYQVLDSSKIFKPLCPVPSRSKMNVTFTLADKQLENKFISEAENVGIYGIKGHSTVGGIRVSLYNAVSIGSVATLCEYMREFERHSK